MVKTKRFLLRLCCMILIVCMLPAAAFAAKPPSQAGERKLEGGQRDFKWPVPGQYNLSSCYLDNRSHYSLDIAAPTGSKVVASYAGTVIDIFTDCEHNWGKSKNCCSSWGNYVLLQHSYTLANGNRITLYSRYAHLTKVSVKVGQTVAKGETIGTVGSTGRSSGPHLDYDVLYGGTYPSKTYSVDPYINDLLELPEELHTTFGKCCQEYVAYVKKYYPRCTHAQYNSKGACVDCGYVFDWKTTRDIDAMGNYAVSADARAAGIPYSQSSGTDLTVGQMMEVKATVVNGLGETWYEVTLSNGDTAYAPKNALTFQSYFPSKIKLSNCTMEDGMKLKQESYRLDGQVTSTYPLRSIVGYLDGKQYASWSSTGGIREASLRSTALNKKLNFAELAPGEHTLTIYGKDSTGRDAVQIYHGTFVIEKVLKNFTVTYVTNGETNAVTLQEGQALGEMPVPSMEGFLFLGWFTDDEALVTAETVPTGDLTLYAKWEEIPVATEPSVPVEPETEPVPTQPTTVPETKPMEHQQDSTVEEKESLWWLIPVVLIVLGGGAGVVYWTVKKRSAKALF